MKSNEKDEPTSLNFSGDGVKKTAFAETLQHPLTLWPSALGITVAVAAAAGLFVPVSVSVASLIALGGVGIGAANFAFRFFGGQDELMRKHYEILHEQFEAMKEQKLTTIGKDLKKLGCRQGYEQVSQFEDKFQNLVTVLERVLQPTELTFGRYKVTAEQVYNSGIENLDRVVTILTNIDDIDRDNLGDRVKTLEALPSRKASEEITLQALRERIRLYDDSQTEVGNLLAQNEQALTAIDAAGVAVGKIRGTKSANSTSNLDGAMSELVCLIERARGSGQAKTLSL